MYPKTLTEAIAFVNRMVKLYQEVPDDITDRHTWVARQMFSIPDDTPVTAEQRDYVKTQIYDVIYGASK